ncbi:1,4-alpha-glucan branching protein [Actinomadura sp. WMMB 499]|uniref:maltokinase N-terminal cap-like domain-containing protein n=1 Tax=Actinomadura sp. WMMB 499 TaxID=1219491 RepID=UPI0012446A6E|nr:1,4-alpha-glucan branching protein [Actinomadura sp. WMMB 499]QFG22646.1 1,4-alpha-glucan branching protein [Actinomadura sp. WMMB 499]
MAVVHRTTLTPGKLDLLTAWLPTRPWYAGTGDPALAKAGGFRLDDPAGEVGIEFMIVTDASGTAYLAPLTYRGAPLDGADHALVGTMEHGVLGRRWAYDGCHDPVMVAQFLALIEGRAQPQDQNATDTPDLDITRAYTGEGLASTDGAATDDREGTELPVRGASVRLHRVLRPSPEAPSGTAGHVAGSWRTPDGTRVRGLLAVVS